MFSDYDFIFYRIFRGNTLIFWQKYVRKCFFGGIVRVRSRSYRYPVRLIENNLYDLRLGKRYFQLAALKYRFAEFFGIYFTHFRVRFYRNNNRNRSAREGKTAQRASDFQSFLVLIDGSVSFNNVRSVIANGFDIKLEVAHSRRGKVLARNFARKRNERKRSQRNGGVFFAEFCIICPRKRRFFTERFSCFRFCRKCAERIFYDIFSH